MSTPTLDLNVFNELQETAGEDFVTDLVGTFLEEAPAMLAELRTALAARKADSFRRAAHSLKSNSHTFGAMHLGEMARALELGDLSTGTEASLDALDAEFAQVTAALREQCRGCHG